MIITFSPNSVLISVNVGGSVIKAVYKWIHTYSHTVELQKEKTG